MNIHDEIIRIQNLNVELDKSSSTLNDFINKTATDYAELYDIEIGYIEKWKYISGSIEIYGVYDNGEVCSKWDNTYINIPIKFFTDREASFIELNETIETERKNQAKLNEVKELDQLKTLLEKYKGII